MRISDWSSDVCSSDLPTTDPHRRLRRSAAAAPAQRRDPVGPEIRRDQEPLPGYLPAGGETVNAALIFAAERLGRLRPALGVVLLVFVWWLPTVLALADPVLPPPPQEAPKALVDGMVRGPLRSVLVQ